MLLGVEEWAPDGPRAEQDLEELAGVLHASVHAGASVSFVLPFSMEDAQAFWRDKVLPGVRKRVRIVLTARARALMEAVENVARRERRTLITLDTRTGDSAEPLYRSMGYVLVGVIPRYAIDPYGQKLDPTSIYYKELT